jgi:hypothetical protein
MRGETNLGRDGKFLSTTCPPNLRAPRTTTVHTPRFGQTTLPPLRVWHRAVLSSIAGRRRIVALISTTHSSSASNCIGRVRKEAPSNARRRYLPKIRLRKKFGGVWKSTTRNCLSKLSYPLSLVPVFKEEEEEGSYKTLISPKLIIAQQESWK